MKFISQYKIVFYLLNLILISLYLLPSSIMSTFIYKDLYFYSQINPDFRVSFNHIYVFVIFSIVGFLTFQKKKFI